MRLTVYTDYSLRVLMYLALNPQRQPTISEIATRYGISRAHVMKVVHQLGVSGYISTARGQKGGMRLARSPHDIRLGEVIRRTEPDLALVPCFDPVRTACVLTPACRLRSALQQAQAAFLSVLDGFTLADLTGNADILQRLFETSAAP
jgi:Rrf2 family nitric oxide-sensitive transcriptional repressor